MWVLNVFDKICAELVPILPTLIVKSMNGDEQQNKQGTQKF